MVKLTSPILALSLFLNLILTSYVIGYHVGQYFRDDGPADKPEPRLQNIAPNIDLSPDRRREIAKALRSIKHETRANRTEVFEAERALIALLGDAEITQSQIIAAFKTINNAEFENRTTEQEKLADYISELDAKERAFVREIIKRANTRRRRPPNPVKTPHARTHPHHAIDRESTENKPTDTENN